MYCLWLSYSLLWSCSDDPEVHFDKSLMIIKSEPYFLALWQVSDEYYSTLWQSYQIPILLEKEPDLDSQGNPVYEPDGKPRYRCGFRIGGGIDQDPSQSPQGYPDKVSTSVHLIIWMYLYVCLCACLGISLTFLHASTFNCTYYLIVTQGRFSHAFFPD